MTLLRYVLMRAGMDEDVWRLPPSPTPRCGGGGTYLKDERVLLRMLVQRCHELVRQLRPAPTPRHPVHAQGTFKSSGGLEKRTSLKLKDLFGKEAQSQSNARAGLVRLGLAGAGGSPVQLGVEVVHNVVPVIKRLEVVGRIHQIVPATTPADSVSSPHPVHTLNGGLAGAFACWTVGMGAAGGEEGGGLREGVVVARAGGVQEEVLRPVAVHHGDAGHQQGSQHHLHRTHRVTRSEGHHRAGLRKNKVRVKSKSGNPKVTVS
jgi:hypothetical protein